MDVQQGTKPAPVVEESTLLERVARLISSVRGAKPDYAHLAAELEPALPFDLFGIVLLRHDREAVRVTVCQREGEDASWVARYHQHPLVDSMVERIERSLDQDKSTWPSVSGHEGSGEIVGHERSAEALFVENFPAGVNGLPAECGDALCGHPQLHAILVVPLLAGGNLLGTLELGSTQLDAYSDPALQRLIHAIARVLATAIEGAQVGGNVEIQNRQRAELKDVSTVLTTAVDLQMILDRIVTGITNALHVASAIVRFDRTQGSLLLDAQSQVDPILLQKVLRQENAYNRETIIGSTFAQRDSQVSQDIGEDQRFSLSSHFASELGVRSLFCYPLLTGQHVYGALLLLSPEPGGFTPLKTDIFALFAGQATVAIHNGMLLQAAQERRRFQDLIKQLEEVSRENVFTEQDQVGEQELLQRLRDETLKTFGVSLGSILHFISDHLLTRNESRLQDILQSAQTLTLLKEKERSDALLVQEAGGIYSDEAELLARASDGTLTSTVDHEETAFLMKVADDALARSDFLNDISAALMRTLHVDDAHPQAYEQLKRELVEPWFIIGLSGKCLYLNHAAELFCGRRADRENTHSWRPWPQEDQALFSSFHPLSWSQESALTLEGALAALLPRMRNLEEVQSYLREFTVAEANDAGSVEQNDAPLPTFLVCTMAVEALAGQKAPKNGHDLAEVASARGTAQELAYSGRAPSPTLLMDMSPSDHHYQFVRHALYNEHGQWFANALHVRDVTEQVRDEKNKSVLLASVSHDLRTPLTAIKGAVTGLLDTDVVWDEQSRREMLEEINTEADHLHSLVTSLVEMSRIEMGALTLDKEWCDLGELVHNTFNRIQRALGDFDVKFEIQPDLPLVHADYAQLGRVFTNLLENAARHSPEQSQIRICLDVLNESNLPTDLPQNITRAVRVQVVDQGPGVPESERERIFKTFYSLDVKGNGLGLAICRGIVEAHQGRIWVEGDEGQGAHFIFILPIISA